MEAGSRTYHARSRLSPAGRPGMMHKTFGWLRANMPTRESMESNRLLRPVAHRVMEPGLWRFNRRSVPRGVALGMVAGFLFPVAQSAVAALFALPVRANVPVAALTTFITNPFTTPFLWFLGEAAARQHQHGRARVAPPRPEHRHRRPRDRSHPMPHPPADDRRTVASFLRRIAAVRLGERDGDRP